MGGSSLDLCCHGNTDDAGVQFPLAHHGQDDDLENPGPTLAVSCSNSQVR